MKDVLITVVLPIYNVEKYLPKCIDSILEQSYKNLEILLINDGSTDNCEEICKQRARLDSRIKIIKQENQGLSEARNTGIKNATGDYICFVDSDDYIHKDFVKLLFEDIVKNNSDISVCDFWYVNENGDKWTKREKKASIYTNIEAIKDILIGRKETEVMTWNKLYKLSLFKDNKIFFPKGKLHEDKFTTYKLYYYASKVSLISEKLYYYLQRENSIMGSKFNIRRLDAIEAVNETIAFCKKNDIKMENELEAYEAMTKIYIIDNMIRANFDRKEINKLIKEVKVKKNNYKKNNYIGRKMKLGIFILNENYRMYKIALRIFDLMRKRGENK